MGQPGRRISRVKGPIGLGLETKGQLESWFKRLSWDATGKHLVARIFFSTNQFSLDGKDRETIKEFSQYYAARASVGWLTNLTFIGCADARYYEDYNKKLAEDRLNSVFSAFSKELKNMGVGGSTTFKIKKIVRGEFAMLNHPDHWAEDRRVDIFDIRISGVDAPKKSHKYTLEDFKDGRLFRAEMFFVETWNPRWSSWWPLFYYIKDIEEKDYIHAQNEEMIPVSKTDIDNMERLLNKIIPQDKQKLQAEIAAKGRESALRNYFLVEFRKVWGQVRKAAERDYEQSDFRYFHEFMAVVLGKVDPKGYAKKKPPSK